jgi:tetratricopeptide (TPR) repeat protein
MNISHNCATAQQTRRLHNRMYRWCVIGVLQAAALLMLAGPMTNTALAQDEKQQAMISWSLAYEQYRQKNYLDAIPLYKQALPWYIANYATNKKATDGMLDQLARSFMNLAETEESLFDSSIVVLQQAIELDPESVKFNQTLEYLYERTGKEEETLAQLERMYEITNDVSWITRLKDKYMAKQEFSKAIETYDILLAADPDNTDLLQEKLNLIRRIANESGDPDAVKNQLVMLHEKTPDNPDYVNELLLIAKNNQDEPGIIQWADKLLALDATNSFAYDSKIEVYEFSGDSKQVLAILQQKSEANPTDPLVQIRIGETYLDQSSYGRAVRAARAALKIQSGIGAGYLLIGEAYEMSAESCIQGKGGPAKMDFNDKLVYKKAYDNFALATKDPEYKSRAQRKMQSLKPVIPEPGDYFMNKGKTEPEGACYTWF